MKKNVLITGGAGFIGSNLVHHHLEKGDNVWAVDNMATGRMGNLSSFSDNPSFRFDQCDICFWDKLAEAGKWADWVYHMAATVGQRCVLADPTGTLSNNIRSCEVVLDAMSKGKKGGRILITSSSEVYNSDNPKNMDSDGAFCEDVILDIASGEFLQETYPLSKIVNEVMGLSYAYQKGIHCTIARLFNTIGPNQCAQYGMVVPNFVEQAISQKPITIFGDGTQKRSFGSVHDIVKALDLLLDTPESNGAIVNVGDDRECSINDLAKLVKKLAHSKSEIKHISYEEAYGVEFKDPQRRKPNLDKLVHLTGFRPKRPLEETLKEIIDSKK